MSDPTRPPIPLGLAQRPTIGGLVIPWVNVRLADGGVDYRVAHHTRWLQCWTRGLCQTCGDPLAEQVNNVALLGGPAQLGSYFDEPPLHPWCARYVTRACPMVAGRMPTYADRPRVSAGARGQTCPEPGCQCGGWRPHTTGDSSGAPAHQWWLVLARSYTIAVDPDGEVLGGVPVGELRRRLVSSPR